MPQCGLLAPPTISSRAWRWGLLSSRSLASAADKTLRSAMRVSAVLRNAASQSSPFLAATALSAARDRRTRTQACAQRLSVTTTNAHAAP